MSRQTGKRERVPGCGWWEPELFTAIMLLSIGIMAWASASIRRMCRRCRCSVVLFGIPAGCIIGTLKVLVDRLKEIGKGEEDAYRNY